MALVTIRDLSRGWGLSTRTLRYWEQIGLIASVRGPGYAYRAYDEAAVARIRQIVVLRRLRVPLRAIEAVLRDGTVAALVDALAAQRAELDDRMAALATVRGVVDALISRLRGCPAGDALRLLGEDEVTALVAALPLSNPIAREEKPMEDLNRANETLNELTDVRILWLPPATVAASHVVGDEPEYHAGKALDQWVMDTGLADRKPDLRHYGFNHPNPVDETGFHGYEMWVTIPDDMEVPPPFARKQFAGGLYAAHMIQMGNFHEWEWLFQWVMKSPEYEFAGDMQDQEHMMGLMEEHLNYIGHIRQGVAPAEPEGMQLDLLIPVRKRG